MLDGQTRTPVGGARVTGAGGAAVGTTDAAGHLAIARPDTTVRLTIAAIGYRRQSISVRPASPDSIELLLEPAVAELPELVSGRDSTLVQGGTGEWVIDGSAARAMPAAVEPDAFRVLKLSPAVAFSSVLSARPLIRGIDAADAAFTIDGHEAINLFHIGRVFSAFPAVGVERLTLSTQPNRVTVGHTTSGRIAMTGRQWADGDRPEIQYGLGAWSGVAGWRSGSTSAVLAGRTIEGALTGAADDLSDVVVSVGDVYGRLDLPLAATRTSWTLFHSGDAVHARDPNEDPDRRPSLDWGNLLIGGRVELPAMGPLTLAFSGSYSSHREDGHKVPARGTETDVHNRSRRVGGGFEARYQMTDGSIVTIGGERFARQIRNVLAPREPDEIPSRSLDRSVTETAGYAELEQRLLGGTARIGARIDALGSLTSLQPRLAFTHPLGARAWISASIGRTSSLIHLISDARTEPRVAYYDIWLPADGDSIPPAVVDHATLEVGTGHGGTMLRAAVFAATGRGQYDLVPEDPRPVGEPLIRSGRLWVGGIELEARRATTDGRWFGEASYTLSWSERDWGSGWVPWVFDRRHQLRLSGAYQPIRKTTFGLTAELASGRPYTPITSAEWQIDPPGFRRTYGPEYSARGRFGLWVDLSLQRSMRGPFGTDMVLGVSLTNLALGDQSPRESQLRYLSSTTPDGVENYRITSEPLFALPPVPSVLLRVMF